VLCVTIDNNAHTMAVANAGHLPPLLANGNEGHFVPTTIGPPVGVSRRHTYEATTVTVPPKGTLLMFTDGLVERRGESLDIGLHRLHEAAVGKDQPLEEILVTIVADLIPGGAEDDAAILGVRWHN
jgi:serine phosphatase RsbU (regulator of sigma subunit)